MSAFISPTGKEKIVMSSYFRGRLLLLLLLWLQLLRRRRRLLAGHCLLCMLRMLMRMVVGVVVGVMVVVMGVETLRGRVVGVQRAEGSRDELWGQRVENVGLLELQCLQLGLDLLEGDAVQAGVLVADGDEVLPKLPGTARMRERGTESRIFNECHFSVFSVGFKRGRSSPAAAYGTERNGVSHHSHQ